MPKWLKYTLIGLLAAGIVMLVLWATGVVGGPPKTKPGNEALENDMEELLQRIDAADK